VGFGLVIVALFLGALGDSTDSQFDERLTLLNDFYYPPRPTDIRYPTCTLGTPNSVFEDNSTLADFAFLSGLPYKTDAVVQQELADWFQRGEAVEDEDTVTEFRNRTETTESPVFFRLFRIKYAGRDIGVISIRGTQNSWDLLADSQLWSAAILVQGLRAVLPIGEMWTPILDGKSLLSFDLRTLLR
jgi:lipase ATG15